MSGGVARVVLLAVLAAPGCAWLERDLPLPSEQDAAAYYRDQTAVQRVALSGNVIEVYVVQDADQLRRGGSLWAKVAPYVYVFSPGTRALLDDFAGVAAVRVITEAGQVEIARALLHRDTMNDILWRRSLNILGHALQEGTRRPTRLEELVVWGERHTEYRYNPDFVPEARGEQ